MRRFFVLAAATVGIGALVIFVVGAASAGSSRKVPALASVGTAHGYILKGAATGHLKRPLIPITVTRNGVTRSINRPVPTLSGAAVVSEQQAICAQAVVPNCDERAQGADAGSGGNLGLDSGTSPGTLGCSNRNPDGATRVNQDCTFRRQAEEEITYNSADPSNLVAGQNDSRVGFNQCGIDFSTDNGKAWGDMLPPFRQSLNDPQGAVPNTIGGDPGTFHTYDAASDPVNATDSRGRAFFSCVMFDVASNASGVFVTESPVGAQGSFYFNVPGPPNDRTFVPVQDNSPLIAHDKNWIAADHYVHSPNRDNVYVTWTVFKFGTNCLGGTDIAPTFCQSPIYGSMSTDHGQTWSAPEQISGASPLCSFGDFFDPSAAANSCDLDQGSNPVVLPNGDLEVIYNNGNTPAGNPNAQQLGVHCRPTGNSVSGTAHLNCASPAKVGDDVITGEPLCDFGRGPEECIPGAYIRTNDFPRIVTENTQNNHLYAVWQDYRNGEFDIHMAKSTNGGLTWTDAGQVNPESGLDHYMPAVDQSPDQGDRLGVSYYRTGRVPGENTTPEAGFAPCGNNGVVNTGASTTCQPGVGARDSDYVVAGGTGSQTPYAFTSVSPVFPPPDGIQSGFNGDYSGITINQRSEAHPIWSDTRSVNPYPANGVRHDEDVFTARVNLPNGRGQSGQGHVGQP